MVEETETTVKPAKKVELYDRTSLIIETAKDNTLHLTPHGDRQTEAVEFIGHSTGTEPNAERELVELEFWSKDGVPLVTMQAPDGESFTVPVDRDALEFHQEYFENGSSLTERNNDQISDIVTGWVQDGTRIVSRPLSYKLTVLK